MNLRYSPRARRDLAEIADYLTARSPNGALSVERRIRKTIDLITAFPGAGRRLDRRPAVRVMPLGRYPYLIFYTLHDDEIVVLHVRHGARKPIDPSRL
ncbi:MAG TPA: type II toxin-antitoxin system RelE/ParE family toxin [Hyphomicrobiaceae bacterium]